MLCLKNSQKKKFASIAFLMVIALVLNVQLAFAGQTNCIVNNDAVLEAHIMSYDYARPFLSPTEKDYLSKHPDLATKRAEKDCLYLMKRAEKQMNAVMSVPESAVIDTQDIGIQTVTVYLGTDATITSCEVGNKGGEKSGLADYASQYSTSGKWSDVSTITFGWGDAEAWSWVGPRVYVSGPSGAYQLADVRFYGRYEGSLFGGVGGSSYGKVRVSIWDYTSGAEVGGYVVWEKTSQNDIRVDAKGNIACTIQAFLRAGHTYAFRFGDLVTSAQYGIRGSNADFWNNGSGPEGLDVDKVVVDF